MKCPGCGNVIPEDSVFCQYCGGNIQKLSEEKRLAEEAEAARLAEEKRLAEEAEAARLAEEKRLAEEAEAARLAEEKRRAEEAEAARLAEEKRLAEEAEAARLAEEKRVAEKAKITNVESQFIHSASQKSYVICPSCKKQLPIDSVFCQYCGADMSSIDRTIDSTVIENIHSNTKDVHTVLSDAKNDNVISNNSLQHVQRINNETPSAPAVSKNSKWPRAVLIILAIALAGLNAFQFYLHTQSLNDIASKDSEIKKNSQTITSLEKQVSNNELKASYFDFISDAARRGTLGYAASNFYASEDLIVISKSQTNRKFTLTAHWQNGGNVSVDYDFNGMLPPALVDFDKNSWSTSVSMSIIPYHEGITRVIFTNDVDSKSFDILIIVTE